MTRSGVCLVNGRPFLTASALLTVIAEGYDLKPIKADRHDMGRKVAWTFRWERVDSPARMDSIRGVVTFEIEVDQDVRREKGDDLAIIRTRRPAALQLLRHFAEILGEPRLRLPEEEEPTPATAGPTVGDLRVWWIPQVPMESSFFVPVDSVEEAARVVEILASYDAFQFEKRIKPDYSNVGGLQVYEADDGDGKPGWVDWYAADGDDFDEYRRRLDHLPDFWSWKKKGERR